MQITHTLYNKTHLTSIRQMSLQIHMHVHIRILNRANRLDMIQSKTLRDLSKVRRRHRFQKPRHDFLDRSGLLLRQFVYHRRLGDALDVDVVGGLP